MKEGFPNKTNEEVKKAFTVNGSLETGFTIQEIGTSEDEMKDNQFTFETQQEAENFIEKEKTKITNTEKEGM